MVLVVSRHVLDCLVSVLFKGMSRPLAPLILAVQGTGLYYVGRTRNRFPACFARVQIDFGSDGLQHNPRPEKESEI